LGKLDKLLIKLENPDRYIAKINTAPSISDNKIKAAFIAEERGKFIGERLVQNVGKIELHFEPQLPPNSVSLSFLTKN